MIASSFIWILLQLHKFWDVIAQNISWKFGLDQNLQNLGLTSHNQIRWMPHLFSWQAITLYGLAVAIKTNLRFRPKLYSKIIDKNLFWFWAKKIKKMFDHNPNLEVWSAKSEMDMLSNFRVAIAWYAQIVHMMPIKCIRCVDDST